MKPETRLKKIKKMEQRALDRATDKAQEVLDKYFPKGDKRRGEALVILAIAIIEGFRAGKMFKKEIGK